MSLGESIRSGTKWLLVGNFGSRMMEFAFGVILARLLVPADFGMIVTIQAFTGIAGMLTSGGMGQSLIRAKTADDNDFTAVFTLQLTLSALLYAFFFVLAPWIAAYFENPLYTDLIRVSTVVFLLRPFALMRISWLNRRMEFKSRSLVEVGTGLITSVSSVAMAFAGMGVWSLTLSGLVGALALNVMLARVTSLKLRLNPDISVIRKHASFGFMITANDFVTYLRVETKYLIISKLAGPAALGLFNKAESMSRVPNQIMVPATMEPVFRAMSKVQDNLDQNKYLFYRAISLLMVYTLPLYILLWWIAEPFITVVYGEKWSAAGAPMSILAIAGFFLNILYPCSVVLAAQNRLKQELLAQSINLPIILGACYFGLKWGLEGVAWGIVFSHALLVAHFYWLICHILPTRLSDLLKAVGPGVMLGTLLFALLALVHAMLGDMKTDAPFFYLLAMSLIGGIGYTAAFLLIPFPSLRTEAARWREKLHGGVKSLVKSIRR